MDENDPKAENLMLSIWHGKEASRCDGNMSGYSSMHHIMSSKTKRLTGGEDSTIFDLLTNHFKPNYDVDYAFQYRYRSKAI